MGLGNILKRELENKENDEQIISIRLERSKINELDNIVREFKHINPDKIFTKERLIEIAIDDLIEESNKIIREHRVAEIEVEAAAEIDITDSIENIREEMEEDFNTVIFAAQYDGFKHIFLGEKKWRYVRLGKDKLDKIKYVACYVGVPVSAITHYARVDRIEEVTIEGKKKYIIYFAGDPIQLERKIPIGNAPVMSMRANRYVLLEQLLSAQSYEDFL